MGTHRDITRVLKLSRFSTRMATQNLVSMRHFGFLRMRPQYSESPTHINIQIIKTVHRGPNIIAFLESWHPDFQRWHSGKWYPSSTGASNIIIIWKFTKGNHIGLLETFLAIFIPKYFKTAAQQWVFIFLNFKAHFCSIQAKLYMYHVIFSHLDQYFTRYIELKFQWCKGHLTVRI